MHDTATHALPPSGLVFPPHAPTPQQEDQPFPREDQTEEDPQETVNGNQWSSFLATHKNAWMEALTNTPDTPIPGYGIIPLYQHAPTPTKDGMQMPYWIQATNNVISSESFFLVSFEGTETARRTFLVEAVYHPNPDSTTNTDPINERLIFREYDDVLDALKDAAALYGTASIMDNPQIRKVFPHIRLQRQMA